MKIRIIFATIALLSCFSCAMAKKVQPSAKICNAWIEQNVNENNGLVAHVDFDVENWAGDWCYVRLYIYDNERKKWLGTFKNECCLGNYDCICRILYDEVKYQKGTSYRDVKLYIPLKYMQLKNGTNNYYASVEIGRIGDTLARSKLLPFTAIGIGGAVGTNKNESFFSLSYDYEGALNDFTTTVQSNNMQSSTIPIYNNAGNRTVTSNSNYKSNQSSISAVAGAVLVLGAIAAVITEVSKSDNSSSSSYSSSSSHDYSTKKYSSEAVARLLSSGNLYACRFDDGSNMTRIDAVTRAKIIIRGGDQYLEIPDRLRGTYKLLHGYSNTLKGGVYYMNEGGDNWYLMDQSKNIILF